VVDHDVLTNADLNNALFLEVLNEDQVEYRNSDLRLEDRSNAHLHEDRSNAPLLVDLESAHIADDQAIALDHPASHHAQVVIPHVAHLAVAENDALMVDAHKADAEVADVAAEKCRPSIHRNSLTLTLLR
jgi:hypothetical protein